MKATDIIWGTSLPDQALRLIEQYFVLLKPKKPVALPQFPTTDLPDPAEWRGCIIYASNTNKVMFSDGAAWGNV